MNRSNNSRIEIVLILPSLASGGMERVMCELAIFFAKKESTKVHLVLLGRQNKFYSLPPEVTIHEPDNNDGKSLLHILKTIIFLRKTLFSLNPDAVLSFGEMYNSFVLLATLFTTYKVFVSDRSRPNKNWGHFHHFLRFVFYRRAYGIIAQTSLAAEIMAKRISHPNIKIIGNPIKSIDFDQRQQRKNIILTVGRMIPSKRHDLLIKLFHKTVNDDWQLHFLGSGPQSEVLQSLVMSLGLQQKVVFLGTQQHVEPYYSSAKIFAFTSNSEGFPNVLGEAMSAGLAPITFNFTAGASDLVTDNKNGFLIEMDNEQEYIEKLNLLMQDSELVEKLGKNAKESIRKFSTAIVAEEYYNFILS